MDRRRLRFVAALVLFAVWVAALGILAASSARRPVVRAAHPAAVIPRGR
jgi:hypothetical protein